MLVTVYFLLVSAKSSDVGLGGVDALVTALINWTNYTVVPFLTKGVVIAIWPSAQKVRSVYPTGRYLNAADYAGMGEN